MAENAGNVPLQPFARQSSAVEGITQQGRNASIVRMEALPKRVQPVVRCALQGRMEQMVFATHARQIIGQAKRDQPVVNGAIQFLLNTENAAAVRKMEYVRKHIAIRGMLITTENAKS